MLKKEKVAKQEENVRKTTRSNLFFFFFTLKPNEKSQPLSPNEVTCKICNRQVIRKDRDTTNHLKRLMAKLPMLSEWETWTTLSSVSHSDISQWFVSVSSCVRKRTDSTFLCVCVLHCTVMQHSEKFFLRVPGLTVCDRVIDTFFDCIHVT